MRLVKGNLWERIRKVLFGSGSHELLVFLFFLAVSFGFWLLQTLNETFEREITIPVKLENIPENVLITSELPPSLTVVVRDKGTSLVRYFRKGGLKPLVLDFSKYDNGASNARVLIVPADVQRTIQVQLEATTHIQSVRPDSLEFYYNRGFSFRLPVKVCSSVTTSAQHYLQGIHATPDSVTVYAPTSVLDTMRYAYTQVLKLTDLKESASRRLLFRPIKGVKYQPGKVDVTAWVGYYTEKTVEVPIIGLNFPADKELRTFPAKAKITFRVGSDRYDRVTPDNFVLAITYEDLLQNTSPKYKLHLKSLPAGVSNVRISPYEVDYLIERSAIDEENEP